MMAFMFPKDSQFVSLMVNKENDFGYLIWIFLWICNKSCPKNYGTAIITPLKLIISVRSSKKCFFNNTFTLPFYSSFTYSIYQQVAKLYLLFLEFTSFCFYFLYTPRFPVYNKVFLKKRRHSFISLWLHITLKCK